MGYFCLTYLVTLILFTLYPVVKDVAIVVTVVDVDIIVHVVPVVDVAAVDNFDALVNAYLDVT